MTYIHPYTLISIKKQDNLSISLGLALSVLESLSDPISRYSGHAPLVAKCTGLVFLLQHLQESLEMLECKYNNEQARVRQDICVKKVESRKLL